MTEEEWKNNSDHPKLMVEEVSKLPVSPRKLRLYLCALWKEHRKRTQEDKF